MIDDMAELKRLRERLLEIERLYKQARSDLLDRIVEIRMREPWPKSLLYQPKSVAERRAAIRNHEDIRTWPDWKRAF